ncbi:Excinuclease ABC subunit C [Alkalithermobacter thermoalcaliphilus JW-YL-7 = DSM 7308]|uniref:UvrABC system protein C n=1 Tax=Alkalithermobacter thermoalcaliphilus JW-YL-7 = DSM 7308 TaxID=1121328 RepID=A0A150FTW5_CLOPD|nr:UvrABC system protein C [[Clostridium] paradoxum JW-YL-7 = DSM 7308]SHL16394.1 Excinuclease ABC subunit C [[Clostridium] paradoxum JW-YL-7 = DSM 7308]
MRQLREKLKKLPDLPGVYLMKDSKGNIIYVGKAISLKNRVRQYFQSSKNHSQKVVSMVKNISDFEYIITDSELEALILECNLIKKHKPKYNILLRDDKTYPYIKVTLNEKYPRVLKVRKIQKDKAKYFGPYTNTTAVNDTLEIIRNLYPIRTCSLDIQKAISKKQRPCLNFYIKKCLGPCTGNIDDKKYEKMVDDIIAFLSGKGENIIKTLKDEMKEASLNLQFEKAASIRDRIKSLEEILEKQKITFTQSDLDQDVIGIEKSLDEACIQIFFIREGKIVGREHFIFEGILNSDEGEILSSFIKQFYSSDVFIPKEIILDHDIEDSSVIMSFLSSKKGQKVNIKVPKKGDKKELVELVRKNAKEYLEKFSQTKKVKFEKTVGAIEVLKEMLNLEKIPTRIEAFDISNIQGVDSVGAMVVITNGKKDKKEYRRFKINSVDTPNDYKSMQEILYRRLKKGNYPDLLLLDGGKGHVSCAKEVLKDLGIDIPVWGMYKDDKHKTKGLVSLDKEINLDKSSNIYKFISSIQEEVHNFALTYHRSLREKNLKKSILDDIPSIGDKRKNNLLKHFKTIENIKNASIEELEKVEGMNSISAKNVYEFFRKR